METEVFRDIEGFEGLYQISDLGNVQSLPRIINSKFGHTYRRGIELTPFPFKKGKEPYLAVDLMKNGKRTRRAVHQLVLETFVGKRPSLQYDTIHKNGNGADNRLENLRWGTKSENQQDRKKHGTDLYVRKIDEQDVQEIIIRYMNGEKASTIAKDFFISKDYVYRVCYRRNIVRNKK